MSRAMNLKLTEAEVVKQCNALGVSISTSEVLPDGGTHLVCTTSTGADDARKKFHKHIIEGRVKRFAFYDPLPAR